MLGMDTKHVLKNNTTRRKQAAQIMLRMEDRTCFKEDPDNAELALLGNELMSEGQGRFVGNNTVEAATFAVILVTFRGSRDFRHSDFGEAVTSDATPIDSVTSSMVVTFVTAAPWAIAFAIRLSRGYSSLSAAAAAAAAHQL